MCSVINVNSDSEIGLHLGETERGSHLAQSGGEVGTQRRDPVKQICEPRESISALIRQEDLKTQSLILHRPRKQHREHQFGWMCESK